MIYEFECPKGHVTEASCPIGTKTWLCEVCIAEQKALHAGDTDACGAWNPLARRILSPTRTTFVFADTHRR
jgi:hypothetical protein